MKGFSSYLFVREDKKRRTTYFAKSFSTYSGMLGLITDLRGIELPLSSTDTNLN
jgi:hypothetical protein